MVTKRWIGLRGILGAAVLLAAWGVAARAENAVEQLGNTAEAKGRGGADVAVGDSALSQIENPATLIGHGREVDLSAQLVLPRTRWDSPRDTAFSEFGAIPLVNFGVAHPINEKLSWGWAFYTKSGLAAQYHLRHKFFPQRDLIEHVDYLNFAVPLNIAYQVNDRLSIGGGIRAEFATARLLSVFGPVDANLQRGYSWGGGFLVGAKYKLSDAWTLGFGYRSPSWMGDFQGNHLLASISPAVTGQPPVTVDLGDVRVSARQPQKLSLGAAWDVSEKLTLASDVRWINYAESFLNEATVKSRGLRPFVPGELKLPFGYRDQVVVAVGADRKLNDRWTASAGYNYSSPVIPGRNLYPLSALLPQHHITVGMRYEGERWTLSGGYILGATQGVSSGPSVFPGNLPGSIDARVLRNDFANSFISQTQHSIYVGIGYKF